MNQQLMQKTQEWMQLERKTFEQRRIAEEYYESELMKLVEEDFIERNAGKLYEAAEYMIVSVGTSYEPIVLSLRLFNPQKVLFLYTEESGKIVSKIINYCQMDPMDYVKRKIGETDPLSIYKEIKNCYIAWNKPKKLYIDFTGGTKAMSAAVAMAGAVIDVQLIYVGTNDYLVDFRKPNPGSETLYYITNPLAVFGDLEVEKAIALFGEYNYSGVKDSLQILKENVPDPNIRQEMNFIYLLAEVYEAWDGLDFESAYQYVRELNRQIKRDMQLYPQFLMMDFYGRLKEQEEILMSLSEIPFYARNRRNSEILKKKKLIISLMFTICQNAFVREEQGKYDMATLLYYRLLEMIEQRRLFRYNLYVSKMDYKSIRYNTKDFPELQDISPEESIQYLKGQVREVKINVFGKCNSDYLPDQVSLLDGYIILAVLGDPIICREADQDIHLLKRIRSMVLLRNNSIFAHGLGPVSHQDFLKFKQFVLEMFEKFCKIERIPYEEYRKKVIWLNPADSKNYSVHEAQETSGQETH